MEKNECIQHHHIQHSSPRRIFTLKEDYPDAEIMGHCELEGVHKACPCFSCQEYRDYFERKDKLV